MSERRMAHVLINPPNWPRPSGYSNAVEAAAGRLLFISGQIGWDADQKLPAGGNFVAQFKQALANVLSLVHAGGGQAQDIVKLTIYVTDRQAYLRARTELASVYPDQMGRHYPAMTLVEVKSLVPDGACVEIEAVAVIP